MFKIQKNPIDCGVEVIMHCPYCSHQETKVIDKRNVEGISKRRRECLKCEKRFNTQEIIERAELRVVKKDGRRETFDTNKLKIGIQKACEKRPISLDQIEKMLTRIEEKLRKKGKEVHSTFIGDLVSSELKKTDKVAYIRFASVYKDFTELDDFKLAIASLMPRESKKNRREDSQGFKKEIKDLISK